MSLGLAAPLWLLGLLGLLAPLVLHLLARGRGRRVRVGSVRLLTDLPPRRPRRLQLQRPLLLALRCLLLALVALALAAPRLRRETTTAATPPPWVLVEPGVDARAIEAVRGAIAASAEVRLLTTGLPRAASVRHIAELPDLAAMPGGLWSLLREAAAVAPAGTRFLVVTSGRLAALRGERPALANAVEWHEVPDPRSNRWVARTLASATGATLLVGESDRTRTIFRREPAPTASARSLRVSVLAAADRQVDARYVRAALAAAAEAAGVRIEISPPAPVAMTAVAGAATDEAALRSQLAASRPPIATTFWLADAAPPAPLLAALRGGGVLITDSGAPEESCEGTFAPIASTTPVALHRCGDSGEGEAATSPHQRARWRSDSGRVVLAEQPIGDGRWLRFGSRFHPAWSDLVLSPTFPEWLRDVLRSAAGSDATSELPSSDRRADGGQGRPASASLVSKGAIQLARQRRDVRSSSAPASPAPEQAAWLLLFPLLLAERWLATRR
ncbi:MAG TPA: BatA domain-containing protein [Thermoanaerobaculia bacterium]|nr:BatA domain-containing protein [Thermoanaerobaculia bacterium]